MENGEKDFGKINSVSLSSNSNILEQVQTLLLKDLGEK